MGLVLSALSKLFAGVWSRVSITGLLVMIKDKDLLIKVSAVTIFSETLFKLYELSQVQSVEGFKAGAWLVGKSLVSTFVGSLNRVAAGMMNVQGALVDPGISSLWGAPTGLWMVFSGVMTLYILSKLLPVMVRTVTGGDPDLVHAALFWSLFLVTVLLYNGWSDVQSFLDASVSLMDTLAQLQGDPGVNQSVNRSLNQTVNSTTT